MGDFPLPRLITRGYPDAYHLPLTSINTENFWLQRRPSTCSMEWAARRYLAMRPLTSCSGTMVKKCAAVKRRTWRWETSGYKAFLGSRCRSKILLESQCADVYNTLTAWFSHGFPWQIRLTQPPYNIWSCMNPIQSSAILCLTYPILSSLIQLSSITSSQKAARKESKVSLAGSSRFWSNSMKS